MERAVRRVAFGLMDAPLLDAFHYPHPTPAERAAIRGVLKARAALVRRLPAREKPVYVPHSPTTRSYPNGFRISDLGTFPRTARSTWQHRR